MQVDHSESSSGGRAGGANGVRPWVVGIVGGMGPLSTWAFFGELVLATPARRDQDHLRVLVDSDPTIPDRTAFLTGGTDDPRPKMVAAGRRLVASGANVLVIPCNSANVFRLDIERACGVETLDWIGIASAELQRAGHRRIGVLATTGTVVARSFQDALVAQGIEPLLPTTVEQELVMAAIYGPEGVKAGSASLDRQHDLLSVADALVHRGAEAVILGCTELPLAISAGDPRWPVPTYDPARAVAAAIVARTWPSTLVAPGEEHP